MNKQNTLIFQLLASKAPINGEYGIKHDLYLGTPTVINGEGIREPDSYSFS